MDARCYRDARCSQAHHLVVRTDCVPPLRVATQCHLTRLSQQRIAGRGSKRKKEGLSGIEERAARRKGWLGAARRWRSSGDDNRP